MKKERKINRMPTKGYLEQAKALSKKDAERLMSRMGKKFTRRLEDKKLTPTDVQALQLELEDEQLKEWRKKLTELRDKKCRAGVLPATASPATLLCCFPAIIGDIPACVRELPNRNETLLLSSRASGEAL